jgi:uncharacterized protein YdaU (DUF1376 family)
MTSVKLRRVDFYPGDWLGGTVTLSLAERGLYITACMMIYEAGGPIRKADLRLAVSGRTQTFNSLLLSLVDKGKLRLLDGMIDQIRCAREIERAQNRIKTAATIASPIVNESFLSFGTSENETNDLSAAPRARARRSTKEKKEERFLEGDLGVAALPSPPPPTPDEIAEVEALCKQATTTLRGGVSKGIRDPVAYQAAITDAKFTSLVKKLNAWVGTALDGEAQWAAWEVLAAAQEAGTRSGMDRAMRRNFNKLDKLYRAAEPIDDMELAA